MQKLICNIYGIIWGALIIRDSQYTISIPNKVIKNFKTDPQVKFVLKLSASGVI